MKPRTHNAADLTVRSNGHRTLGFWCGVRRLFGRGIGGGVGVQDLGMSELLTTDFALACRRVKHERASQLAGRIGGSTRQCPAVVLIDLLFEPAEPKR